MTFSQAGGAENHRTTEPPNHRTTEPLGHHLGVGAGRGCLDYMAAVWQTRHYVSDVFKTLMSRKIIANATHVAQTNVSRWENTDPARGPLALLAKKGESQHPSGTILSKGAAPVQGGHTACTRSVLGHLIAKSVT